MKKTRNVLWILFFISMVLIVVLLLAQGEPETGGPGPSLPEGEGAPLLVWIPLITALVSLTGALTTTILTMKRDRLESHKMELEVTKLQLEIDRLRNTAGIASPGKATGEGADLEP